MTARRRLFASGLTLALGAGLLVASATQAAAASIVVTTTADTVGVNGSCSLREAIINANTDAATNTDCAAGSANDTITFTVTGTIPVDLELTVSDPDGLTIQGPGANQLTLDGGGVGRVLRAPEPLSLVALTVAGGNAVDGGGISSDSTLIITNSTISGNSVGTNGGGIFNNFGGTLTITNSAISGNTAGGGGGGIYNDGTLTVTDSAISGNTAGGGGGVYNEGTLTITNSTLSDNSAISGGGIYNDLLATATITNSTLSDNSADAAQGGGIYNEGTLTITNSTLSDNSASSGGGIYNEGTLTITNSTLSGNSAGNGGGLGGGIYNDGTLTITNSTLSGNSGTGGGIFTFGPITITNSTLSDNSATDRGGGVYAFVSVTITNSTLSGNSAGDGGGIYTFGILTITNSTLSDNSATGDGGGIYRGTGTVTLRSTIVANSPSGGDCATSFGTITDGGYNLDEDGTCTSAGTSLTADPVLGPLSDNGGPTRTHALLAGSPALDQIPLGSPPGAECGTSIDTDQRGVTREPPCDIGAYEPDDDPSEGPPPGDGDGPTLSIIRLGTGSGTITSNPPGISCPPDCSEQTNGAATQAAVATTYVLSAHPLSGSTFTGWSGPCTGTSTCTITLSDDLAVSATFDLQAPPTPAPGTFDLHASRVGKGRVMSASAEINCGTACTATYQEGTSVTLTASPHQGWVLKRWRYGCSGSALVCTLEMSSNRRAKAVFVRG